jgi:hypothetical protein
MGTLDCVEQVVELELGRQQALRRTIKNVSHGTRMGERRRIIKNKILRSYLAGLLSFLPCIRRHLSRNAEKV